MNTDAYLPSAGVDPLKRKDDERACKRCWVIFSSDKQDLYCPTCRPIIDAMPMDVFLIDKVL